MRLTVRSNPYSRCNPDFAPGYINALQMNGALIALPSLSRAGHGQSHGRVWQPERKRCNCAFQVYAEAADCFYRPEFACSFWLHRSKADRVGRPAWSAGSSCLSLSTLRDLPPFV